MALKTFRRSAPQWPWSRRLRRTMLTSLAAAGLAVAVGACSSSSSTSSAPASSASGKVGGSLTVWVDSVRLPAAQAYAKAHPDVNLHIVTFDGDANGATTISSRRTPEAAARVPGADSALALRPDEGSFLRELPNDFESFRIHRSISINDAMSLVVRGSEITAPVTLKIV